MGEKYAWANPEFVGSLTLVQLRFYLSTKDEEELPEGTREIKYYEVDKFMEDFRRRKGIATSPTE